MFSVKAHLFALSILFAASMGAPASAQEAPSPDAAAPSESVAPPAGQAAAALVSPEIVKLFEEQFPLVMNATLVGRDCADHDKLKLRELNAAIEQLIPYADPKPELSVGVVKVLEGQKNYEQERVDFGGQFCAKRGKEIVDAGVEASRVMIEKLGLVAFDPKTIDVAGIAAQLTEASAAIGAYDKCKKWIRDMEIASRGRTDAFVFMQALVSDIRNESEAIKGFVAKNGAPDDFAKRLADAEAKGRETGVEECSLKQYSDIETALENIVQRHGLQ